MNGLDLSLKVDGGDRHTFRAPLNVALPTAVGEQYNGRIFDLNIFFM